jgi:hypothetical protein
MVALSTTDRLSPNRYVGPMSETPRYLNAVRFPMICSVAVLAETNSEPYVAVSTVLCFLEYQSKGVFLFTKCNLPVTDLPVSIS